MARICTVRFLSAVCAAAARRKLPFALRPGLSQEEVMHTKEMTRRRALVRRGYLVVAAVVEAGVRCD